MEPEHLPIRQLNNERGTARLTYTGEIQDDFAPLSTDAHAPHSPLHHSSSFSFPSLARDGSLLQQSDHPSSSFPTPPAALSSKGAAAQAMAATMSSSVNSLDDGNYDMVDDASDTSIDNPETASLPSTADHSDGDDGIDTPDDTGSLIDVGEELGTADSTLTLGGSHETLPGIQDAAAKEIYSSEHDEIMESFLRDDLETPRQSTMYRFVEKTPEARDRQQESQKLGTQNNRNSASSFWAWLDSSTGRDGTYQASPKFYAILLLVSIVLMMVSIQVNKLIADDTPDFISRRETLSVSVGSITGSQDISDIVNITHLIPSHSSEDLHYGEYVFTPRTAVMKPNRLVLSLPKSSKTGKYQHPVDPELTRADQKVDFNLTNLIDGVWVFTIDPRDAHGSVKFAMKLTARSRPPHQYYSTSFTQDFGRRSLQHATTDLSKALNEEVIVARERVNSLKDIIEVEVLAGVAATRNVTTEVAVYVARDVQVFVTTAASLLSQASKTRKEVSNLISTNVANGMEVALRTLGNNTLRLSNVASSTALKTRDSAELALRRSKELLHDGLVFSRQKALSLKASLTGKPLFANSTSATKELSLRFQNLFNPTEKTKRAGSLPDIARCATAPDYAACRREQRRLALANHLSKAKDAALAIQAKESTSLSFDPKVVAKYADANSARTKKLCKSRVEGSSKLNGEKQPGGSSVVKATNARAKEWQEKQTKKHEKREKAKKKIKNR